MSLRFLINRNRFEGDTFQSEYVCETEQEFLEWASSQEHLGKRDWSLPKYIDENEVEQLPEGHLLVDGNPVEVAKHKDSYSYEDEEGETIVVPERDWIEYKMPDQWSYTVEDITDELSNKSIIESFEKENIEEEDDSEIACKKVMQWFGRRNKKLRKGKADKDSMESDSSLNAILLKLTVSKRPTEAKRLIEAYSDETYISNEEKAKVVAYLTAKGF